MRMPVGPAFEIPRDSFTLQDVEDRRPISLPVARYRVTLLEACPARVRMGSVRSIEYFPFAIVPIPRGLKTSRWVQVEGCAPLLSRKLARPEPPAPPRNVATTINALAADPFGNIVVSGSSNTASLPMMNPVLGPGSLIPAGAFGMSKPFVAKFRLDTNLQLAFSTFVGSQLDCCETPFGVAVDGAGDIYVTFDIGISELGYLSTVNSFLSKSYVIAKNAGFNSDVTVAAGYPRDGGRLLYQSIMAPCGEAVSCRRAPIHARGAGMTLIAGLTRANWAPVAANNHQAAISGTSEDAFVMMSNSENPPLTLESSTASPSANTAFDLVARAFTPGASGQVTFFNGGTALGSVTMAEGVARFSVTLPAGVGRLTASLGADTSPPLFLPVVMGVCP